MTCKYCNEPVVLRPSAQERARKYGEAPSFYTRLFPDHSTCVVAARSESARRNFQKKVMS